MTLATAAETWTAATTAVALFAFARSRARREAAAASLPSVLVLRPCAGAEPALATALASTARAPETARIRFLVAQPDDPARAIADASAAALVGRDAAVVVTGAEGPNGKADQLARAVVGATEDVVLVCDSDVVVTRELVFDLVAAVANGADAAWAPPVEITPRTAADRASARVLDSSLHAFALLSALDAAGMVGKAFAIRRTALDAIGGFGALVDRLGEDMELARRLVASGRRVHVIGTATASVAGGRTWRQTLDRYARWLLVIRAQRPALLASYPVLLAAAPLQAALALAAIALEGASGFFALDAVVFARALVAVFARIRSGVGLRGVLFAPWAADVVLLAAFVKALTTRKLRWRGRSLRIEGGGRLAEAEP